MPTTSSARRPPLALAALLGASGGLCLVALASLLHADPSMRTVPVLLPSAVAGGAGGVLAAGPILRRRGPLLASLAYGLAVIAGYLAGRLGPF